MKRTLTLTFEIDDSPWLDEEEGVMRPKNVLALAMDQVNCFADHPFCGEFVDAKLDGILLVDKSGNVSEEVKQLKTQYAKFLQVIDKK